MQKDLEGKKKKNTFQKKIGCNTDERMYNLYKQRNKLKTIN